ncbi:hypothetical protein [Kistimonas scapharcae]|uniref:hypothetical protein n=1 Tax=Kistimonas scapharcae TaxID=1036133 RepID=UPI0031EFC360
MLNIRPLTTTLLLQQSLIKEAYIPYHEDSPVPGNTIAVDYHHKQYQLPSSGSKRLDDFIKNPGSHNKTQLNYRIIEILSELKIAIYTYRYVNNKKISPAPQLKAAFHTLADFHHEHYKYSLALLLDNIENVSLLDFSTPRSEHMEIGYCHGLCALSICESSKTNRKRFKSILLLLSCAQPIFLRGEYHYSITKLLETAEAYYAGLNKPIRHNFQALTKYDKTLAIALNIKPMVQQVILFQSPDITSFSPWISHQDILLTSRIIDTQPVLNRVKLGVLINHNGNLEKLLKLIICKPENQSSYIFHGINHCITLFQSHSTIP